MKVTITRDDGVVFATHEIRGRTAHWLARHIAPGITTKPADDEEAELASEDLMDDIATAAWNEVTGQW